MVSAKNVVDRHVMFLHHFHWIFDERGKRWRERPKRNYRSDVLEYHTMCRLYGVPWTLPRHAQDSSLRDPQAALPTPTGAKLRRLNLPSLYCKMEPVPFGVDSTN